MARISLFSPQESWLLSTETYGKFRSLQRKLEFAELAPDFQEREAELVATCFNEYQAMVTDYDAKWRALRQKSK